jgi:hypothetical protein
LNYETRQDCSLLFSSHGLSPGQRRHALDAVILHLTPGLCLINASDE